MGTDGIESPFITFPLSTSEAKDLEALHKQMVDLQIKGETIAREAVEIRGHTWGEKPQWRLTLDQEKGRAFLTTEPASPDMVPESEVKPEDTAQPS